jgi:hypothetical protein
MSKRIPRAYAKAWRWAAASDKDPYYVRWLYRLAIFGSPIMFMGFATSFALVTDDWIAAVFFYLFVLLSHPAVITFLYHDYYWLIESRRPPRDDE